MVKRMIGAGLALTLALACMAAHCRAADYPTRPVTLVLGFPPGGASDILGRIIADKLGNLLGTFHPSTIVRARAATSPARSSPCGARRLHAVAGQQRHPRHQCQPLQQDRFRSGEGFCPIS